MPDPVADDGGRERPPTIFDHLFDSGTLTCCYCGTHYFRAMKGWPCDPALMPAAQGTEQDRRKYSVNFTMEPKGRKGEMSVSFMWEVVKPDRARKFGAGSSSDIDAFKDSFGETVSTKDIPVLRAMHRATRATSHQTSLWSEIADTLERLQGDAELAGDYDKEVTLKVWTEF